MHGYIDSVEIGLLYMASPHGCRHSLFIPAEAKALPHEGALALVCMATCCDCLTVLPKQSLDSQQQHTQHGADCMKGVQTADVQWASAFCQKHSTA